MTKRKRKPANAKRAPTVKLPNADDRITADVEPETLDTGQEYTVPTLEEAIAKIPTPPGLIKLMLSIWLPHLDDIKLPLPATRTRTRQPGKTKGAS